MSGYLPHVSVFYWGIGYAGIAAAICVRDRSVGDFDRRLRYVADTVIGTECSRCQVRRHLARSTLWVGDALSADVQILEEFGPRSLTGIFGDHRPPPEITFGIGDVVSVSIFEAAAGGLFIPAEASVRPGNFVTLPNQPIDTKGFISVPYAGLVPTAGKTPAQVEKEIVDRIKNRAIEPQAVVALVTQNTSLITVIGETNNLITSVTGRIPAQPAGEHLLDVITRAGGLRDQGQDLWVTLERHGKRATVPFGALLYEPGNNIWAWPGDTIYLYKEPQTFLAFGATGLQGQFQFSAGGTSGNVGGSGASSAWRMTLAEGVAAAGGLLDLQADPGSVFLFRREPRATGREAWGRLFKV